MVLVYILLALFGLKLGAVHENIHPNSLAHYSKNVYSQRGEDGILEEILRRLDIETGFFVEFGAWDGIFLSNSRLLVEKGWSGLFIEGDPVKYLDLIKNYSDLPNIVCLNEFVTYDEKDSRGKTIDRIMQEHFPNREIDFLSVDIDGADHLILETLKCRPKILCVEGGFSWNPKFTKRVPDAVAFENLQQPLEVMIRIGGRKGYDPVCFTQNTFFVRRDLMGPFTEIANDTCTLWRDGWYNLAPDAKKWLLNFRRTNPLIRNCEGPAFLDLRL